MTVSIANTPLNGTFGLSDAARRVLALIDGGLHWLDYALGEPNRQYPFRDEGNLVATVQTGLHATPNLLIAPIGLMVAPVKLLTMSPQDIHLLHRAATGDVPPADPDLAKVLARYHLATQHDLAGVDTMLGHLEVAAQPIFQAMDLDDRLALLALSRSEGVTKPRSPDLRVEAAAFAVAQAVSPEEFVDYFHVYVDHIAVVGHVADTAAERKARVRRALYTLGPLMFQALDCPEVIGQPSAPAIEQAIVDWFMSGRQLGFERVSDGVRQIVSHTRFQTEEGIAAQLIVRDYLDRAQQLIRLQGIGRLSMAQDGATCRFPIVGSSHTAVVRLDPAGAITLADFATHVPHHDDIADAVRGADGKSSKTATRAAPAGRVRVVRRRKGTIGL